jgi:hypothetical protein
MSAEVFEKVWTLADREEIPLTYDVLLALHDSKASTSQRQSQALRQPNALGIYGVSTPRQT